LAGAQPDREGGMKRQPDGRANRAERIVAMFRAETPIEEIARTFDRKTWQVRRVLRAHGCVAALPARGRNGKFGAQDGGNNYERIWEKAAKQSNAEFLAALDRYFERQREAA
jgi:hypothetical protein